MDDASNLVGQRKPLNYERKYLKPFRDIVKYLNSNRLPVPAVLLIFYTVPFVLADMMVKDIVGDFVVSSVENRCFTVQPTGNKEINFAVKLTVPITSCFALLVAGWLTDTYIGSRTALVLSLWSGWFGTLLQTLSECFQYHSCSSFEVIGKYGLSSLALIFLIPSFAVFYASALAFAMDILSGCSSGKHRSYIYWYAWMFFLSRNTYSITDYLSGIGYINSRLCFAFTSFTFFSLSLCSYFNVNFEVTALNDSYTEVSKIVKGLFSKCKSQNSSKLELGNTHDFRNNKKFHLRICFLLLALLPFWISLDSLSDQLSSQLGGESNGIVSPFLVFYVGDSTILWAIPLLEFLLIPIFPRLEYYLSKSLMCIGLSQLLLNIAILLMFVVDITATKGVAQDDKDNLLLLIPSLLHGIADNVSFVCTFELICYHSPHKMKGLLIVVLWFLRLCSNGISSTLVFIFGKWTLTLSNDDFSRTSLLLLVTEVVSLISLVVYILSVCWYNAKRRQTDARTGVEDHFEQLRIREAEENIMANSQF